MEPLTQEEVSKFNDIIMKSEKIQKDDILKNMKEKTGDAQVEYIRSIINP